jgi:hypothetical protein
MGQSHANASLDRVAKNAAAITAVLHGALWLAPFVLAAMGANSLAKATADQELELPAFTKLVLATAAFVLRHWHLFAIIFLLAIPLDGWLLYRLARGHSLHAKAARRVWSVVVVLLPLALSGFVVIAYLLPVLTIIGRPG